MPEYTPSALAMLTEFFSSDAIEITARQTGLVKRASKLTGKMFLALLTFGVWSAATAGAKIQAVWDYKNRVCGHFALTPWNIPDNRYIDKVVALAHTGVLLIFDLGDFKIKACAQIAAKGAYFLSRLNHQTHSFDAAPARLQCLDLACLLKTVKVHIMEKQSFIGATELVPSRLIAVRMPEAIVNERRRLAKKNAKKKGYTPSKSHLQLLAWNLFITNVPCKIWKTETVGKA